MLKKHKNTQNEFYSMGTLISQKVYGRNAVAALNASENEIERLNNKLSRFIDNSEISMINKYAGLMPVKVSEETFKLIESSTRYSEISEGHFDITIGAIIKVWDKFKTEKKNLTL